MNKPTLNGLPDSVLLERAVKSARDRTKRGRHERWVAVMWCFGLGSTSARKLCDRFGFDPDELVN